jgi:DnaJ-domain-containing protein 1
VPVGSDRETVKEGYRRMMNRYHQDRFQSDDEKRAIAGDVSKSLNRAYDRVLEYLED